MSRLRRDLRYLKLVARMLADLLVSLLASMKFIFRESRHEKLFKDMDNILIDLS